MTQTKEHPVKEDAEKSEQELVECVFNALRGIKGNGNDSVEAAVELHRRYKLSYQQSLSEHRKQLWIDRAITVVVAVASTLATILLTSCPIK